MLFDSHHAMTSPKRRNASGYRIQKAMALQNICIVSKTSVNVLSCIGPNILRMRLINVRLLHSTIFTPSSPLNFFTWVSPNKEKIRRHISPRNFNSSSLNTAMDMLTLSQSLSYLGRRWRGQGTKWNNWGTE